MAMEFCRIAESDNATAINLFPKGNCSGLILENRINLFRHRQDNSPNIHMIHSRNHDLYSTENRLFGASVFPVPSSEIGKNTRFHPWLCSLRTRGFRGRHRCGVTLLSGPTEDLQHSTVLVGAAHCNYICKERQSRNIYETCCCRPEGSPGSCRNASSYCRGDPIFTLAEAEDLQIVCGEFSVESPEPEIISGEGEVVLDILKIINHPDYKPNEGPGVGGPIEGNDISVYVVDDSEFKLVKGVIWPACLPKESYPPENLGILAGWQDRTAVYLYEGSSITDYRLSNFHPRQMQVEEIICRDPAWMNTNTFYPQGTVCYRDPSLASCLEFGASGSGIVRKWRTDETDYEDQYSWIGPLTLSKGCDKAIDLLTNDQVFKVFLYSGENAAVVTDATCYMKWIADQYGLRLTQEYQKKQSCFQGRGNKMDFNQTLCRTSFGTYCNFSAVENKTGQVWDKCQLYTPVEGLAYNVNQCIENTHNGTARYSNCANNCIGVDPNAIIGAGVAAATATALGILGSGGVGAAMSAAGGAILTGGGLMMAQGMCLPPFYCISSSRRCCSVVFSVNGLVCPDTC